MKELYIEEMERLASLYEEQGMGEDEAQALAEANAYDAMTDRLADMADRARDAAKYADFE
jgi:predicted Zn-dependent protease